ncbi:MAG: response regulator [Pseudobdellovibrionaceae bacterium]
MTTNNLANKRVLIVDDSSDIVALIKLFFETKGYIVSTASNGQEALDLLHSSAELPAFILLDIMMPVMDGIAFKTEQECDPRLSGIPVVMMTAFNDTQIIKLNVNCKNYLTKPFDLDALESLAVSFSK